MVPKQAAALTFMTLLIMSVTLDTGWWEVGAGPVWYLEPGVASLLNVMVSSVPACNLEADSPSHDKLRTCLVSGIQSVKHVGCWF